MAPLLLLGAVDRIERPAAGASANLIVLGIGGSITSGAPVMAGEFWTFERAVEFMETYGFRTHDQAVSEVTRYLGWPGQAISYKVGEQAILDLRTEHSGRPDFDLKTFHADLLAIGSVGLDVLRAHMASHSG